MYTQPKQLCIAVLGAALLLLFSARTMAQDQAPPSEAGQISNTLRSASYPEAIYPDGIIPDWDRGYVIHYKIEMNHSPDTPMVVMYDATGKRIRQGRIWPQSAGSVNVRRTAATREGAILATGGAIMLDGSIQHYIVKTDLAGNTVQTLITEAFAPEQICESSDGTIWSLGKASNPENGQQPDTSVLRHYSLEKGLLHRFLPQSTVEAPVRSKKPWFSPFGSYLRCGKDKVSAYLNFTDDYVEVDTSSFEAKRWQLDEGIVQQRKASGLLVTEDGRVYASFGRDWGNGAAHVRGLYEIKAQAGIPIARVLPVAGTINTLERGEFPPAGTFCPLWGADGNQLVVWRIENPEIALSWVNVIHGESSN